MLERKQILLKAVEGNSVKMLKDTYKHSLGVWFFLIRSHLTVSLFEYVAYLIKFMNTDLGLGAHKLHWVW